MKRHARSRLALAFGLALPAAGLAQGGGTGGAGNASQPSGGSASTSNDGYGTTYMTGTQQDRAKPLPREDDRSLRDALGSRDATRRALGDERPAPRRERWWQFWRHGNPPHGQRR